MLSYHHCSHKGVQQSPHLCMRMEELLQPWSQGVVVVGVHCMAVPHVFCTSHTGIWFFSRDICPSWLWTQNLEHSFVNVSFCPIVEDTIVSFMYKQGGEVMVSGKQNWMFSWCDVSFWCGLSCFFSAFCLALSLPVYVLSLPFSFSENVSAPPSGLLGELPPIFLLLDVHLLLILLMQPLDDLIFCQSFTTGIWLCTLSPNLLLNVGITVLCNKKVAKKLGDVKGPQSLRWLLWLCTYLRWWWW